MTFENIIYDKIILSLVLISIPLIASTNIDCGGNSFYCLNSTHFIICVDFGKGVSKTVDDFVIPCPPPTICDRTNRYECEFPDYNTPTVQPIETTNDIESTSLPWEKFAVTVILPNTAIEQHLELSTDGVTQAAVTEAAVNIFDPVNGNEAGNIQITTETATIKFVTVNTTEAPEAFVTVTEKNMTGDSSMTKVMAPVFSQVTTPNIGNEPESIYEIVIGPISGNQTDGVIVDMPQAAILSVTEPMNASVAEPSSIYATEHVTSILNKEVIASENNAVILNDTVRNITVKQETEETITEKHLLNKTVPVIIDIELTITNKAEKTVDNINEPTALNATKTVIGNVTDQAIKTVFDQSAFTETMITTGNKTEQIIANTTEPSALIVTEVNTTYATELPFANVSEIVTSISTESTKKTIVEPALPNKTEPTTWTVTEPTTRNTSEPVIINMTEPSFTNETLPVTSIITESTAIIPDPSSTSVTESAIMIATNSTLSETEVDVANMTESVPLISAESTRKTMSEPAITYKTEFSSSTITESTSKNINEPAIANVTEPSITNKTLPAFWTITEIIAGVITEPYVVNMTEAAILITTDATITHGTEKDIANVTESSAFISTESTGKYMAEPGIINETEPSSWTVTESSGRNMSEPAVENVLELSATTETILGTWSLTKSTDLVALNKTESTTGIITELAIPINVTKPAIVIEMAPIILNTTKLPTATVNESDTWISKESTNESITTLPLTIEIEPGSGDITGSSTRKMTEPTISNVTESAIIIITEPLVMTYATKTVISNMSEPVIINRTISSKLNLTKSGGEKITEPGTVNVTGPAAAYLIERDTNVAISATPVSTDSINGNMTVPALSNESESSNWIATESPTGIVTESDVANVTEPTVMIVKNVITTYATEQVIENMTEPSIIKETSAVTWISTEPTTRIKTELPITNKREAVIIIATNPNLTYYASEPDIANVTEFNTWIEAKSTNIVMEHEQTKTNETEPTSWTVTESITKIMNEPVFANVTEPPITNASIPATWIVAQSPELSYLTETESTTGIMTKLVNTTNANESAIETAIVTDLIMADATDLPVSNLNESVLWISTEWTKGIIKEPAKTTNNNELESGKVTKSTSLNMTEPTITNVTGPIITYAIEKVVSNVTEPGAEILTEIDFTNMTEPLTYSNKGNMTEQAITKETESADWIAMESFSKFVTEPDIAKVTEPTTIIEKDPIIKYATEQVIAKMTEPSITNGNSPATWAVTESITGIINESVIETATEPVIINRTVPDTWMVTKSDSQIIKEPVIAYVTEIDISNISESDTWISTELTNVPMAEPTLKNVNKTFDGIDIKSTARNIKEPIMENVTEAAIMIATDVIMTYTTELANENIVQPVITNATEPNNWIIPESSTGNVTDSIFAHLSESTTWTVTESIDGNIISDGNMEQVISNVTEPSIGNTTNSVTLIFTELTNGNKTKQIDSIVLKSVLGNPTEFATDNKSKSVNKLATEAINATEMAPVLTKSNPTKHSITDTIAALTEVNMKQTYSTENSTAEYVFPNPFVVNSTSLKISQNAVNSNLLDSSVQSEVMVKTDKNSTNYNKETITRDYNTATESIYEESRTTKQPNKTTKQEHTVLRPQTKQAERILVTSTTAETVHNNYLSLTAGNITIPGIVIGAGSESAAKEMTSTNIKVIPVNLSINTPEVVAYKSVVTVTETIQTANVKNFEHASSTALVATTVKNTMSNSKYFTAGIDTIANSTSDINSNSTDNNSYVTINADSGLSLSTIAEKTSVNQKQMPNIKTQFLTPSPSEFTIKDYFQSNLSTKSFSNVQDSKMVIREPQTLINNNYEQTNPLETVVLNSTDKISNKVPTIAGSAIPKHAGSIFLIVPQNSTNETLENLKKIPLLLGNFKTTKITGEDILTSEAPSNMLSFSNNTERDSNQEKINYFKQDNPSSLPADINQAYNAHNLKTAKSLQESKIDTEPKTGSLNVSTQTSKLIKNYQETNNGVNYAPLHKEENSTKKYIITPDALSTLIPKQSSSVNTRVIKTDDLHPSIWLTGYNNKKESGDSLTMDKVFTKENSTYDKINTTESSASKLSNSKSVAQIDTSRVNTKNITGMIPNLNSESSRPDNSQMASSTEVYTDPATLVSSPVNKLTSKYSITTTKILTKINTKKDLGLSTVVTPLTPEQTSTVSVSGTSQFKLTFDCQVHPRGRYADDHDCRKFYICNGTPYSIVGLCPSNTVFSEIRKLCTKNLSHCIRNNEFHCTSPGRFSDFWKTNIYYICVRKANTFLRFKLQCQSGYILNKTTVRCYENAEPSSLAVSNSNDDSQIKTEKKEEKEKKARKSKKKNKNKGFECEKEGKFGDSDDCRKYYICSQSDKSEEFNLKVKKCDTDETYDKKKKKCVDSSSYECS